jgi:predicted negative regulator of RcsB-dependent stress response
MGLKDVIEITQKLYRCRDAAAGLHGNEFQQAIAWYKDAVRSVQQAKNLDAIQAATLILNMEKLSDNGYAQMMFFAAAVEIVESSNNNPQDQPLAQAIKHKTNQNNEVD